MGIMEKSGERVRSATAGEVNEEIDLKIAVSLEYYAANRDEIDARIAELDREWDIERTLELNAASLALTGTILGAFANKRWLVLPVVVATFLVQHAVQGWCPPILLFRKMGIRTRPEIDREKYALKALRGDFKKVSNPEQAWDVVN